SRAIPHRYSRLLCRLFGIRIKVIGKPVADRGVLMVSNHCSWLDPVVLSAVSPASFVAKSEVKTWPLFSTLAKLHRTVFVDRARRSRIGDTRDEIRERLEAGDALVLFPEGTSSDGNRVLPFRSALMGAAETELGKTGRHVPVQPVSVAYVGVHGIPMGRENRPLYAWYGDMELAPHLWEAFVTGPVDAVVEFHAPITVDTVGGRKALAARAEAIVRAGVMRALAGEAPAMPPSPPESEPATGDLAGAVA
ncbi:MAG TPA: lysophospholipid acyltransferase family protein, partial [Rhizomicrobium sp.]|nr:lysophospholipid acyltransferase family protein [Rhizomicrobium sp.]